MHAALVTGAGGFLGRRLVGQLLARGIAVRAVAAPGEHLVAHEGVEAVVADIANAGSLDGALEGIDTVFHLAAMYVFGPKDPVRMWRVNVEGTEHVLAVAAEAGAIAVHVSSASALGRTGKEPVDESYWAPQVAPIHYELTKREAHLRALLAAANGAHVRIAAPAAIYGPGDASMAGRLLDRVARRSLPMFGPADVVQCPVHVDDCADALVRIAEHGRDGELYCLGGEPITMQAWVDLVSDLARHRHPRPVSAALIHRLRPMLAALAPFGGTSRAAALEMLSVGCASYAYSSDKAREALGWRPRSLADGMAELVAACTTGSAFPKLPPTTKGR